MTVNHDVVGSSPTGGVIRHLELYSLSFFGSLSTVVGDEKLTSREDLIGLLFFYVQSDEDTFLKGFFSTICQVYQGFK